MCDLDLDTCTVWRETTRKARKPHTCHCCGGPIQPGDKYLSHFSVYDGYVTDEKQCPACTIMVEEFAKVHGQHTSPSSMPELLVECAQNEDDAEMVAKWKKELAAIRARRGLPPETEDEED